MGPTSLEKEEGGCAPSPSHGCASLLTEPQATFVFSKEGARLVFAVRYLLHGSHSLRSGYERSSRWVRLCLLTEGE